MKDRTPAFRRWFGDSKVVDAQGEPLVVYHGAPDVRGIFAGGFKRSSMRGDVFFATDDPRTAETYTDPHRAWDYQNAEPGVIPLYLRIENPLVVDAGFQHWRGTEHVIEQARQAGHDGVVIENTIDHYASDRKAKPRREDACTVFAFFSPTQVKSALTGPMKARDPNRWHVSTSQPLDFTGPNDGTFDLDDADLRSNPRPRARAAMRYYIRFGHLPRGGKSKNYAPPSIYETAYGAPVEREHAGVSVFDTEWSEAAQRWVIFENSGIAASLAAVWEQNRPMYLLTGKRSPHEGADGEPLLIANTISKVRKLTKADVFPGGAGDIYFYEEGAGRLRELNEDEDVAMAMLRVAMTAELGAGARGLGMNAYWRTYATLENWVNSEASSVDAEKWTKLMTEAKAAT